MSMKRKCILFQILFCVLLIINASFIMGQEEESDEWRQISAIEELIGEWEGVMPFTMEGGQELPAMIFSCIVSFDSNYYVFEMKMDCEHMFDYLAILLRHAGYSKDILWEEFVEEMIYDESIGKTVFVEKYYIKMILKTPVDEKDNFAFDKYFINQHGSKLKSLIAPQWFYPVEETILTRKQ